MLERPTAVFRLINNITMLTGFSGEQLAVADEHHSLQAEALPQVREHRLDRLGVVQVVAKHMMRDRPAVDPHHPDQDLALTRLAVA